MISIALMWLKGNWKQAALGIALLALALYIGSLHLQLGMAEGRAAKLAGNISQLESEKASLNEVVRRWGEAYAELGQKAGECSAAVDDMAAKAKQARAEAAAALKAAEARASSRQILIEAARARESGPARSCEQAVADAKADLRGMP